MARDPATPDHARRHGLLTQGTPSFTQTIADAVVMKDGDLFLLADPDGRMPSGEEHGLGLYYHDCRYLHTYEIRLSGALPVGLGSGSAAGHCAVFQLTSPDVRASDGATIAREQLGIAWERALDGGDLTLTDTIRLVNWGREPIATTLDFRFGSRFEDVFEVRGLLHEALGTLHPPEWNGDRLQFAYDGKDECRRSLTIELPNGTKPTGDSTASVAIRLEPRGRSAVQLRPVLAESRAIGRR